MLSRIEEIKTIAEANPKDPFPLYGLAIEYKNLGLLLEARATFAQLLECFESYVPQYLIYGQFLLEIKENEEAKKVFEKGLLVAKQAGNRHAHSELSQALSEMDSLWDE